MAVQEVYLVTSLWPALWPIWPTSFNLQRATFVTCPARSCYWDENDVMAVQGEMSKFRDLEYCKIDLIAAKGIVFVKYAKSSSALLALESILANDCMVTFTPNPSP